MPSRRAYRVVFLSIVLGSVLVLLATNVSVSEVTTADPFAEFREQADRSNGDREPMAAPRDGVTVVTAHAREAGDIVALNPNGTVLYHDDTHDGYFDVDPSAEGEDTVVYTAVDKVYDKSLCEPVGPHDYCIRQLIERANLTTGEVTVLYERIGPRYHSAEWHDVDRINETHYVVADMYLDRIFVVNVDTDMVVWEWSAQRYLPLSSGGSYPSDWVHLNDVEVLDDGRFMVSLRNQDQVVFVNRTAGVDESWTLGGDDRHDVLHEQHNPDYIPPDDGGPAALVSDSENNRVIEYQRTDGSWERTWTWQDPHLQWPRDADRLPNGHTLITDSHGGRIIEVDQAGSIVWELDVPRAYEAERLHTGDESTGGPSATSAGLESRTGFQEPEETQAGGTGGILDEIRVRVKGLFPNKLVNAVAFITPPWMEFFDLLATLTGVGTVFVWLALELKWAGYALRSPFVRVM